MSKIKNLPESLLFHDQKSFFHNSCKNQSSSINCIWFYHSKSAFQSLLRTIRDCHFQKKDSTIFFIRFIRQNSNMCVFFRQQISTFYILVCNKVCMACRNIKCDCKDCLSVVVIKTAIVARYITHSGRFWKILSENYMAFLLLNSNSIQ